MKAIDGVDNGVNQYDTDLVPKYVNDTHLSARVGRLNPDWMDEQTAEKEDEAFHRAMDLTGKEFMEVIFNPIFFLVLSTGFHSPVNLKVEGTRVELLCCV